MKRIILMSSMILLICSNLLAQINIRVQQESKGIKGATIICSQGEIQTDENGDAIIDIKKEETVTIKYLGKGYISQYNKENPWIIDLDQIKPIDQISDSTTPSMFSQSSFSEWAGASVLYNFFDENNIDNLVATANIKIGQFELDPSKKFGLNLIGIISNISEEKNDEVGKNISAIAQSNQGFQVGLQPSYLLSGKDFKIGGNPAKLTLIGTACFKYNQINISKDSVKTNKEYIGLPQGKFSIGLEFEGIKLQNGKSILFGSNLFYNLFDSQKFEKIFNEKKNGFLGIETGLIIPIGGRFGFKISNTISKEYKPIWSAGVVIANIE